MLAITGNKEIDRQYSWTKLILTDPKLRSGGFATKLLQQTESKSPRVEGVHVPKTMLLWTRHCLVTTPGPLPVGSVFPLPNIDPLRVHLGRIYARPPSETGNQMTSALTGTVRRIRREKHQAHNFFEMFWCPREDSNLHVLANTRP